MAASDYNPNIPQPTDTGATMQPAVLLNFGAIMDLIDVDHVDFASINAGKHNKITFPVQSEAPTFTAGELGLFSELSGTTDVNELYVYNAAGVANPITASILSTNAAPSGQPGWCYLPCGILMKWGMSSATGTTVVPFPVAANIPVFTGISSLLVTTVAAAGADQFAYRVSYTPTQMTVYGSARTTVSTATVSFEYIAIGY